MLENKDLYFVAVKVFLQDPAGRLLITKDIFNDGWDLPGGRLRGVDFAAPLEKVVERKILEELGEAVNYELNEPVVFMRHEREELLLSGEKERRRIFAIGYRAKYLDGEIKLGPHHEKYQWVFLEDFIPEDYFNGGWLQGVKEFQEKFSQKNKG